MTWILSFNIDSNLHEHRLLLGSDHPYKYQDLIYVFIGTRILCLSDIGTIPLSTHSITIVGLLKKKGSQSIFSCEPIYTLKFSYPHNIKAKLLFECPDNKDYAELGAICGKLHYRYAKLATSPVGLIGTSVKWLTCLYTERNTFYNTTRCVQRVNSPPTTAELLNREIRIIFARDAVG